MKYIKQRIYIETLPKLIDELKKMIHDGAPVIDNLRCVYIEENDDTLNILTAYDFLDLDPKPSISKFFLCQVLKN